MSTRIKTVNEIPKEGIFSKIKDKASYIKQAFLSITRNKRRSLSMISGLILGISILVGIMLYSTVLMNNVYDTVIEGSPYEIRMDFKEPLNQSDIDAYLEKFRADPLIADAQAMYGDSATITRRTSTSMMMYEPYRLETQFRILHSGNDTIIRSANIISYDFYNSKIGLRLREKIINDPDLYYENQTVIDNGIIIPESLAESEKIQIGYVIEEMSFQLIEYDVDNFFQDIVTSEAKLTNLTVVGILSESSDASAGIFSMINSETSIYVPEELFTGNNSQFLDDLVTKNMKYCVLKIEESKFNLADPTKVNTEINTLINKYEKEDPLLRGSNLVEQKLIPFQILSTFIFVFDSILAIPVVVLSLYLLSFGIDLSLHDRRYQIGILKIQGASASQIKRKILVESLFLAIFGMVIGYIVAIFGAWGIGTAKGFLKWNWDYALSKLPDFFVYDQTALLVVGGLISVILILMVNGKANTFIEMEISESVRHTEEKRPGFLRRNNLDVIFFAIGILTLILALLEERGVHVDLGPLGPLLALVGPILWWIGGAAVVARLAKWLPKKTDPLVKRLGFLKDVSVLVKGNIFRKSGDVPRLALIIALTVSFSILAAVQGTTGEVHKERLITWTVGSDLTATTSLGFSTPIIKNMSKIDGINEVMALGSFTGLNYNDPIMIYSVDADIYASVGKWHSDALDPGVNKEELLTELANTPNGCLVGKSLLKRQSLEIGDKNVPIEFLVYKWTGSTVELNYTVQNMTIVGTFDHTPGGIGGDSVIVDHSIINTVSNLSALADIFDTLPSGLIPSSFEDYFLGITDDPKGIIANKYLISVDEGTDVGELELELERSEYTKEFVLSATSIQAEITRSEQLQQMDYGIPGLLTADFVISLMASTLATFIFMSILMEKRKKEFAIMRSYGASKGQVYKIVFSETIVLLLTSVIWGLIVGIGLAYLFNGFFEFIEVFVTPYSVLTSYQIQRVLVFDPRSLFMGIFLTFLAMLIATFLSVRSALQTKISLLVKTMN